ncbi:MAG: glycosyltransferase [Clostridia bacterium]|nr:glycosyltransferase [Clostridia bacterium]MBQ9290824.1 glycosyltransferase [Clostridia bacterium]
MAGLQKTIGKGLRYLRARGIRKTVRKTALHIDRKRLERRFARSMWPTAEELEAQRNTVFRRKIRFSVIVPLYNTPQDVLREMVESVRKQSYPDWELCLADGSDADHEDVGAYCRQQAAEEPRVRYRKLERNEGISGNTNAALDMAAGEYVALFDHDDLLMPNALYEMARKIEETDADFLYSDEMIFSSPKVNRILGIRFKQDFAPEDLLTNNYICHLTVFRRRLLETTGGFRPDFDGSQDHDLVLRLTAAAERVAHVPKVLYLWRSIPGSVAADVHMKEYAIDAGRRAVESFLRDRGETEARVESTEVFPTMYRIRYPVSEDLTVRVIIDGKAGGEDRFRALQSGTDWPGVAWSVLEGKNGNRSQRYAAAEEEATEDYLVFMDDPMLPLNPDWLREMLMWAQRPEIGAVGAKIRLEGGTDLRHTGVILGLGTEGIAGRPYFDREDDLVGFFGQLAVTREVSAVTDCWMVKREKLEAAGGLDPAYGDALFDIDLCLRLREKGYRNLWTPYAALRGGRTQAFFLDVGREAETYDKDRAVFRRKWQAVLERGDPYYNPNLSLKYEDWRIKGKTETESR